MTSQLSSTLPKVGRPATPSSNNLWWSSGTDIDGNSVNVEQAEQIQPQTPGKDEKDKGVRHLLSCPTGCQPMRVLCPMLNCGQPDTEGQADSTGVNKLDRNGMNELHYAARFNRFKEVRTLVEEKGAKVNGESRDGATALHYAAKRRMDERNDIDGQTMNRLISYLVDKEADVNAADKYKCTPLHVAAMRGNAVVAEALLACEGIDVDAQDHLGVTPLMDAVTYNHIKVVRLLFTAGCEIACMDEEGTTALHLAAVTGNMDIIRMLVENREVDKVQFIQWTDTEDNTALHFAVENGNTEVAEYLLSQGAGINSVCRPHSYSYTPLHLACASKYGSPDMVELLLENGARTDGADLEGGYPIHVAADYDNVDVVKLLLLQDDNHLEHRDDEGYTPLLIACCWDYPEMVRLLLDSGADILVGEQNDRTAAFLAAKHGQEGVLEVVLKEPSVSDDLAMARIERQIIRDAEDDNGDTPMHAASKNGFDNLVKRLLEAGAQYDIKNENEETPFILAAANGHANVCTCLLEKTGGRCLNDSNEDSNTALHLAADKGYMDVVRLLLEFDADAEARNSNLSTPLHFAAASGHLQIVEVFIEQDVQLDPLDKSKTTPLQLACKNGHVDVVRLLLENDADVFAEESGDVSTSGRSGATMSALDIAIQEGNESVAAAIIQTDQWKRSLMNDKQAVSGGKLRKYGPVRCTPMRELIRKMPGIAKKVLDRCRRYGKDETKKADRQKSLFEPMDDEQDKKKVWVEHNFELLDDTMSTWDQGPDENVLFQDELYDKHGMPNIWATPYTRNTKILKDNHPLMLMVAYEQEELLCHPVVHALIKRKWAMARLLYFAYLLLYTLFVCVLSAYLIKATPPYHPDLDDMTQCDSKELVSEYEKAAKYVIFVLAGMGLLQEVFELISTNIGYVFKPKNYIDVFTYVSAILVVIDFEDCGVRTDWQWQLAAFCGFVAWMDLLLLLRRLPVLGIYIVMVVRIMKTFVRVFAVFVFFIVAFALAFHVLLGNKLEFSGPFYSLVKTSVMMIGEMDFTDMFHPDSDVYNQRIFYEKSSYAIFIAFLVLMSVIVMNLMTGLAVDDVKVLQQKARLGKLAMQIELALDVEIAVPLRLLRWTRFIVRRKREYVKDRDGAVDKIVAMIEGHDLMDQSEDDMNRELYLRRLIEGNLTKTTQRLERIESQIEQVLNELNNNKATLVPVQATKKRQAPPPPRQTILPVVPTGSRATGLRPQSPTSPLARDIFSDRRGGRKHGRQRRGSI